MNIRTQSSETKLLTEFEMKNRDIKGQICSHKFK